MRRVLAFIGSALLTAGCIRGPEVARIVNGHDIDGRFIEPDAYAAYMEGALLEEQGNLRGAEAAYLRALEEDSGAGEIWARLGRVRCTANPRGSDEAFQWAHMKGSQLGEVWVDDARCGLERGNAARARSSAARAAALDPGNVEASLLVIEALVRTGDRVTADRWLRAARLLYPEASGLPDSLEAVSAGSRRTTAKITPPTAPRPWAARDAVEALDGALRTGDADAARRAAVHAHVSTGWLALRAVELGRLALATESAEMTLLAEPSNVDARVALLAAADLSRDEGALRKWAGKLPDAREPTSALAARVMSSLLERRVGTAASRAFTDAWTLFHPVPKPAAPK